MQQDDRRTVIIQPKNICQNRSALLKRTIHAEFQCHRKPLVMNVDHIGGHWTGDHVHVHFELDGATHVLYPCGCEEMIL